MESSSKVTFQIMSDLHIEIQQGHPPISEYITPNADVLILAGDIGRIHKYDQLKMFLKNICGKFQIVLYVLGNHEYYRVNNIIPKSMDELLVDLEKIRADIPNLYILNRQSVVIDNVCIAGCTLWSQAFVEVPSFIVKIKDMHMNKYNSMFKQDLRYIEDMIIYCREKKLKLLVVTHHCPTYLVSQRKKNDRYKSLYASNLDYLLDSKKIHTWVCGHVHYNFDFYTKNGTRLVSNQKGKEKDHVTNFSKSKIIEV